MHHQNKVNCSRGAPMGRYAQYGEKIAPYKFRLYKVGLNSGGYDAGGAYWGHGATLYCAASDELEINGERLEDATFYLRATSRDKAKQEVLAEFPNAKFYR